MKHTQIWSLLISLTVHQFLYSQDVIEIKSKTAIFSEQSGTLISKEFIDVGEFKEVKVRVVNFSDLVSKKSISSVRLETDVTSKYSTDTKRAILDSDEIEGLRIAVSLLQEKVFPNQPDNYTEVSFVSRGGFEAGCFWSKNKWSTYLKLNKSDSKSFVFLEVEDLNQFLKLLNKADSIIKSLNE